jgi:tetratricopeptide (TPR) repeat protein
MKYLFTIALSLFISMHSIAGDTLQTASGLRYFYVQKGEGVSANAEDVIIADYIGYFTDGKIFDSSIDRGQPFVFTLGKGQVIKGMDEGVSMMRVGDRMIFIMPPELAYGEKGAGDVIPPNTTLIFDVELLDTKEESLASLLFEALENNEADPSDTTLQVEAMFALYDELAATNFEGIYKSENDLNAIGYTLLSNYPDAAVKIFSYNIELYPKAANPYDSMGEAYMLTGEVELAIINYAKSLQFDPANKNAGEMIQKLQSQLE